jgi:hypothetical protein
MTLGRAVAGSAARQKARSIGREDRKGDREADTPRLWEHDSLHRSIGGEMASLEPMVTSGSPIGGGANSPRCDQVVGLFRGEVTGAAGPDVVLEAADGRARLRAEDAIYGPSVIIQSA